MRTELFYNPRMLCERLAVESVRRRRLAELRGTPAARLRPGHIDTLELLKLACARGIGVIYDVGANAGTFSLLSKAVIPEARIHAFEPLPDQQVRFRNAFGHDADVTLHPVALGIEDGTAALHVTDFADASSILPLAEDARVHFGVQETGCLNVKMARMDSYRAACGLPFPDLIKLDVQGYEREVLRGGEECLSMAKAVISEVSFLEYYEGQCLFHELTAWLAERGFFVEALGINTPLGEPIGQTDALYMRRR